MSVRVLAQGYNCQQLVQIFIASLGRKNNITYTHLYGQIDFVYLTNVFFFVLLFKMEAEINALWRILNSILVLQLSNNLIHESVQ